jgi:late competence protein required for DNA uptake (superfamily II DNA/RNA helicase)
MRPLKCNKCGKIINEIAYSESGDEEHIYCRKCWAMIKSAREEISLYICINNRYTKGDKNNG